MTPEVGQRRSDIVDLGRVLIKGVQRLERVRCVTANRVRRLWPVCVGEGCGVSESNLGRRVYRVVDTGLD